MLKCVNPNGCHNPNRCGDNNECCNQAIVDAYKAREKYLADAAAGYHWRDGWYFRRLEDGSVRVVSDYADITIPAPEWASIMASVSAAGETSTTYRAAQDFHASSVKGYIAIEKVRGLYAFIGPGSVIEATTDPLKAHMTGSPDGLAYLLGGHVSGYDAVPVMITCAVGDCVSIPRDEDDDA